MDCPNCGVYNPEDRIVCWRCDQELPKPKQDKKKRADPGAMRRRMWIMVIAAILLWVLLSWVIFPLLMGGGGAPAP
ncbi:MAG: hypothetical protein PVG11_03245 [Anaerolineae bacterium]|jgi:uncharacterized membrane protein YvbJ